MIECSYPELFFRLPVIKIYIFEKVFYMRKYKIEPKRIRFVHPNKNSASNLVLIEGKLEEREIEVEVEDSMPELEVGGSADAGDVNAAGDAAESDRADSVNSHNFRPFLMFRTGIVALILSYLS